MELLPVICNLSEKKLAGKRLTMSFSLNQTRELWQSFMPRRKEIENPVGAVLYSIEVYPPGFFDHFDPSVAFKKWAAIVVTSFETLPPGMEPFTLSAGMYVVFLYKGLASEAAAFYRQIFETWLPGSGYRLDNRPHFARMGEKYKNEDPESEEEIWIPVC